jgi:Ser/Thr protein kinase RdoA (MazF antagonist)
MKPFRSLTEIGQARRLRPLALKALQQYDLEVARLRLVTNDLNCIFRRDTAQGEKYILRVTLPEGGHTRDHVAAEMDWLRALARDTDLSVPRPLAAKDGSLVVQADAPGVPQPRQCAIFSWVPGTDLAEHITPANMAKLGELMARLHQHALTYQPPPGVDLLCFDRVFPFPEPVLLFEQPFAHLFPPERRSIFQESIDWVQAAIDRLKASGEPMRILHNDLHQWNVRIWRGRLSPIDFEDLMWGWPVQDIATTLYYHLDDAFFARQVAFQEGYTRILPWPERCPGEIGIFLAAQAMMLANFILTDPNPSWRIQAPEFVARIEKRLHWLREQYDRD